MRRMRNTKIPWCKRVELNLETTVGSFVLRPVFIPGMASESPVATDSSTYWSVRVSLRSGRRRARGRTRPRLLRRHAAAPAPNDVAPTRGGNPDRQDGLGGGW